MGFINKKHIYLLIFIGSVVWSLTMVRSGLLYEEGMGFWGPNSHDGLWHISVAKNLENLSFDLPIYSGEKLKNYHIGFGLLLAALAKFTNIDYLTLYFQILPVVVSLVIGYLTYKFIYLWKNSLGSAFWGVFFVYFGGGFGYLVSVVREGKLAGDSMFWIQSSASTLINPPFALSLIILLSIMIYLVKKSDDLKKRDLAVLVVLCLLSSIIKIYLGLLVLFAYLVLGLYKAMTDKTNKYLILFLLSLPLVFFGNMFINKGSLGLVVFYPLWFLETMMAFGDRLYWEKYFQAMVSYKQSVSWFRFLLFYFLAFVVFMIGNLGTRIIAFLYFCKNRSDFKKVSVVSLFIFSVTVAGFLVPMLFLQKGTPWNTIQFSYYSVFLLSIVAGVVSGGLLSKSNIFRKVILLLLVFFTIPTTITTLGHYLYKYPHTIISKYELEALSFLEKEEDGTVLDFQVLRDEFLPKKINGIIPIYSYESTAYVSAITGKNTFYSDEVNLNILNVDWNKRKSEILKISYDINSQETIKFLRENQIKYIYLIKRAKIGFDENYLKLDNIFENHEVIIYRVI